MRGPARLDNEVLLETASAFLLSGKEGFLEILGRGMRQVSRQCFDPTDLNCERL
jgi:hypothetical protein